MVTPVWFPILKLWDKLQVLWQITVVSTWLKGNIDNSGDS